MRTAPRPGRAWPAQTPAGGPPQDACVGKAAGAAAGMGLQGSSTGAGCATAAAAAILACNGATRGARGTHAHPLRRVKAGHSQVGHIHCVQAVRGKAEEESTVGRQPRSGLRAASYGKLIGAWLPPRCNMVANSVVNKHTTWQGQQ